MNINYFLSYIVKFIHILLVFLVYVGGFIIIPYKYAYVVILFIFLTMLSWYVFNYDCILTNLEKKLNGTYVKKNYGSVYDGYMDKTSFSYKLFNEYMGLDLSAYDIHFGLIILLIFNMIVLFYRKMYKYNFINY
jgi:hypothetical protein